MTPQFKRFTLIFSFLLFASNAITAQITLIDSTTTDRPTAIPVVSINARIELVGEKIKNIKNRTRLTTAIVHIDTTIPRFEKEIDNQVESFKNFKKSHPNKQKVINLVNKWGSYNAYLESLQFTINDHTEKNSVWLKELQNQKKRWELTYDNAVEKEAPAEVLFQIKDTQKSIDKLFEKICEKNNYLLKLEIEILILKEKINSVIEELNHWKQSEEFSILHRRHYPLWNANKEPIKSKETSFDAWVSFKGNIKGVYTYLLSPENFILTLLVILALLGFWFWRIKKVSTLSSSVDNDNKQASSKLIIADKPLAAFVFSATVVSVIYFSNTPNLLSEFLLLVCLVSSVPIVRPNLHARFKTLLFFIIVLYIMNTLKSYVWYTSLFYRLYLYFELAMLLVVIIKFTWPLRKTVRLNVERFSLTLIKGVPFYIAIVLAGFASDTLGYTNFTDFCLKVLIQGGTLIVVLYGMITILEGLTSGTLQIYYSKNKVGDYQNKYVVEQKIMRAANTFAYLFSIFYFMYIIDVYDIVMNWLTLELNEPVDAGLITFTWGSILTFFGVLIGSYIITSIIAKFIEGGALDFLKLPKGVPAIISVVVRYFIIAFAIVLALSFLGVDFSSFNIMAGALGLGIGFGLQNIISNFISGLILIFERPIQSGDVVEVGSLLGNVRKIGVRSSNIRTFNGAEVVVPNSNLITNEVINWTLSDSVKRMEIKIGTAYGSSMREVVQIIKNAAEDYEKTLKDPEPQALFEAFGDSSLNFRLLYWVPVEFGILSKSEISIDIYEKLAEHNITIPFPQRDVNFRKEDLQLLKGEVTEEKPKIAPAKKDLKKNQNK
jgi:small-conductance mechanosensitive channel